MTAKRNDNGDLEVVKVGNLTFSYRAALLALVLSATPIGQPILKALGISTLETPVKEAQVKVHEISRKIDEIHSDLDELKTSTASLDTKVNKIEFRLTGFQVDFDKYKASRP